MSFQTQLDDHELCNCIPITKMNSMREWDMDVPFWSDRSGVEVSILSCIAQY
jgi:hypothetical protein